MLTCRREDSGRHVDDACSCSWIASIGVPAAMRPIMGTATGRVLSSSAEGARTRPRLPSMTLGTKPRARAPLMPWWTESGSLITSMARARLGSRRMKPRSSSAVIRRWMPDLERRSSASFISSNDGGIPASFKRSWMKRSNSYCLRVSIWSPLAFRGQSCPVSLARSVLPRISLARSVFSRVAPELCLEASH